MEKPSLLILFGFLVSLVLLFGCIERPNCGDGVCEKGIEDNPSFPTYCVQDCQINQPICGNGNCEKGEDQNNCPQDCGSPPVQYHSECQNQQCVQVEGTGTNQCQADNDCQTPVCSSENGQQQTTTKTIENLVSSSFENQNPNSLRYKLNEIVESKNYIVVLKKPSVGETLFSLIQANIYKSNDQKSKEIINSYLKEISTYQSEAIKDIQSRLKNKKIDGLIEKNMLFH